MTGASGSSSGGGGGNGGGSSPSDGKILELKSPMGKDGMTYTWPLKKGRGSVRRSEASCFQIFNTLKL